MIESCWVINFQQKISNLRKGKVKESQRRSTNEEIEKFSKNLADPRNNYATSLERFALKNSSNDELFGYIKNIFDEDLDYREFKLMDTEKNLTKDAHLISLERCPSYITYTSIERLRYKYKVLKLEW